MTAWFTRDGVAASASPWHARSHSSLRSPPHALRAATLWHTGTVWHVHCAAIEESKIIQTVWMSCLVEPFRIRPLQFFLKANSLGKNLVINWIPLCNVCGLHLAVLASFSSLWSDASSDWLRRRSGEMRLLTIPERRLGAQMGLRLLYGTRDAACPLMG